MTYPQHVEVKPHEWAMIWKATAPQVRARKTGLSVNLVVRFDAAMAKMRKRG